MAAWVALLARVRGLLTWDICPYQREEGSMVGRRSRSPVWDPLPRGQIVEAMDEEAAAFWFQAQGASVRLRQGHWWVNLPRNLGGTAGFWVPVQGINPLGAEQIGRPHPMALGYRAVVAEPERATGSANWEIVPDINRYDSRCLARDRARGVRRALSNLEFHLLCDDPEPLVRWGPQVAAATSARSGKRVAASGEQFAREICARYEAGPQLVVGAFSGKELVAYAMSHAIDGTAHFTDMHAHDHGLRLGASDGLYWCTLRAWSATPGVTRVDLGMQMVELPGFGSYKASFGARATTLPVVGHVRQPLSHYLRRFRPVTASRLGIGQSV